jgi:opacity protein-like surface antigen
MRKVLISLAAAGAALVVASPAAAQDYPQPQPYAYGNGYNGYGHNNYAYNNYGGVRALQARVDALQWQIKSLDRRDRIRDRSADRLRDEAKSIEHRLHRAERYGLNPYEANDIQARLARLEQRVQYAASRYGRYGNGHYGDRRDRD